MRDLDDQLEVEIFNDYFNDEIESWHNSSICCCQYCYMDYCIDFPAIYSRLITIDLNSFREQTRIFQHYTDEEYKVLISKLKCPNCTEPFVDEVYAFELPFKPSSEFYKNSIEIAKIGITTPFMLSSHPFAKEVFIELERIHKTTSAVNIDKLYRGRKIIGSEILLNDFSYPPADKTYEGRYNHSGIPVLYLASTKEACYYECKLPKENFYIAEIDVQEKLILLDLTLYVEEREGILQDLIWSSLLSAPKKHEGWENPQYIFSRFIADCANFIGFDGIKYPSVEFFSGENIVLFKPEKRLFTINEFSAYNLNELFR